MRKNSNEFDEKQLLERGKAYRNGYFTLLGLILAGYFINDGLELHCLDGVLQFNIFFWVSFAVCAITMIVKDAYDGINSNSGVVVLSIIGFSGLVTLTITALNLLRGRAFLGSDVGHVVMGLCCVTICTVYWAKRSADKKMENS